MKTKRTFILRIVQKYNEIIYIAISVKLNEEMQIVFFALNLIEDHYISLLCV